MAENFKIGDRVKIRLNHADWYEGRVVRIDPYSAHRSFYWVELDEDAQAALGGSVRLISVFNPKNIQAA
jgi:hypothetical protein